MGVLEDFTATMRNVAQMQAGRGQRTAETGRSTREALAMLQAQFNQMAQAGRATREAGLGREHEAELLGTRIGAEKALQTERLGMEGVRAFEERESRERMARAGEAGALERLKIGEAGANRRAWLSREQDKEQHEEMIGRYGQKRGTELFNAMVDLELLYREDAGENWANAEWKAANKQRYHDMYVNKLATLGLTQDEMATVERSFEAFWTGEAVSPGLGGDETTARPEGQTFFTDVAKMAMEAIGMGHLLPEQYRTPEAPEAVDITQGPLPTYTPQPPAYAAKGGVEMAGMPESGVSQPTGISKTLGDLSRLQLSSREKDWLNEINEDFADDGTLTRTSQDNLRRLKMKYRRLLGR